MAIVYDFNYSEESKDTLKRVTCPICNQGRQSNATDVFDCSECGSTLLCDNDFLVIIKHNNVKLKISNLIGSALIFLVILGSFAFYNMISSDDLLLLGILFVIIHYVLFASLLMRDGTQFQGFVDLSKALISLRIKYYDWGSKIFILSILIGQIYGVFLIIYNC